MCYCVLSQSPIFELLYELLCMDWKCHPGHREEADISLIVVDSPDGAKRLSGIYKTSSMRLEISIPQPLLQRSPTSIIPTAHRDIPLLSFNILTGFC